MWYLKETGRSTAIDKTKPRRQVSKTLHVVQLNFWRKRLTVTKQNVSETARRGFFCFRFIFCKNDCLNQGKSSRTCFQNFHKLHFKPPDLSHHRLTIYKIFKATYSFHSQTQFPLMRQQYYSLSLTDKIHYWNSIKIIFTWNNQKWYIPKAYFTVFASSKE